MHRLVGQVRNYAWGSTTVLPALLGRPRSDQPVAEMWFGAHPSAPSGLEGDPSDLADVIGADAIRTLGARVVERFGPRLPFLVKLLAVGEPLSLQLHPSADAARAGFAAENERGVPVDAAHRSYRDDLPKPEMLVALGDFEALCGFRRPDEILATFEEMGVDLGRGHVERGELGAAVGEILLAGPNDARKAIEAAVEASRRLAGPHAMWVRRLAEAYPGDAGVVVAVMLNHVRLAAGEALFLGPGRLHSYLSGLGLEVMAASDNVIRGGLTPKHVDVDALLTLLDAATYAPEVQAPAGPVHRYEAATPFFSVSRIADSALDVTVSGPEILVVTAGTGRIGDRELVAGEAMWIGADEGCYSVDVSGTLFRVTVGGPDPPIGG